MQKEALFDEEARRDPAHAFHHHYERRDKERDGSPTYDHAGFRLDCNKVMDRFKPVRYNKRKMVKGMDRALARGRSLEEHTAQAFFEGSETSAEEILRKGPIVLDIVRDIVPKDFGIPRHKIDHSEIDMWEQKGFKKHKTEDWMTCSDEDKERDLEMMGGSKLRA